MIDLSLIRQCDSFVCMTIDIGSIIIGIGLGVLLMTLLFWKRLTKKEECEDKD